MAAGRRDRRSPGERFGINAVPHEVATRVEDARTSEAAKTARLRALRLAKETADRAATRDAGATQRERGAIRPRANAAG
jgi:hypothetical protein